jgi:hypothetical protein
MASWDSSVIKTDAGADLTTDNTGRAVVEVWANGAHSIPMTVDAAKALYEAIGDALLRAKGTVQ